MYSADALYWAHARIVTPGLEQNPIYQFGCLTFKNVKAGKFCKNDFLHVDKYWRWKEI